MLKFKQPQNKSIMKQTLYVVTITSLFRKELIAVLVTSVYLIQTTKFVLLKVREGGRWKQDEYHGWAVL